MKRSDTVESKTPSAISEGETTPLHIKFRGKEVIGEYRIGKLIGRGSFGIVMSGKHILTGK